MTGYRAALVLLAGVLASGPLGTPETTPIAEAAALYDHRDRDDCHWIRTRHGRERVCDDRDRHHGRRDRGQHDGWQRIRHDDHGDCFRTPWGLACETDLVGVFRVRDRHRGDEPGPDCDLLIVQPWGWQCHDSPNR
jgi:hypothetical protein